MNGLAWDKVKCIGQDAPTIAPAKHVRAKPGPKPKRPAPTSGDKIQKGDRKTISIVEAAALLGVARTTMYKAVQDGQVPVVRVGKRKLIMRSYIEGMMEKAS